MADTISTVNQGILDSVKSWWTSGSALSLIGWVVFGIIIICAVGLGIWWWWDKKLFNKKIEVNEIVGDSYEHTYTDKAKTVKVGKGGYEIMFLKKLKVHKIGLGGRTGRSVYKFFVMPDGYWYNGRTSANLQYIDQNKGLIPAVATNLNMRAQYTSLEKQIDSLHEGKKSFWDTNKAWIIPLIYLVIIGVFSWLSYREIGPALTQSSAALKQSTELMQTLNQVAINIGQTCSGGSGLIKTL